MIICKVPHGHTTNRSLGQVENAELVYACAVDEGDPLDGVDRGPPAAIWTNPGANKFYQGSAS